MTIESATHVSDLNASYPAAGDAKSEGDDHIRLIKTVVKTDVSTLSASASTTLSTVTAVSTVAANVSTSLGNVSTSLGNVSTSLGNVSTSLGNVSTSLGNVSTSLSTNTSTLTAVSSTVSAAGTPAMVFVSSQTASASSYIQFTGLASGYDYLLTIDGVYLSGNEQLVARLLNSGTPDSSGSYDYVNQFAAIVSLSATAYVGGETGSTLINLSGNNTIYGFSASATERGYLRIYLSNPASTTNARMLKYEGSFFGATANCDLITLSGSCAYRSTTAVDGIRVYVNGSSTITAGTFNLYKIARS